MSTWQQVLLILAGVWLVGVGSYLWVSRLMDRISAKFKQLIDLDTETPSEQVDRYGYDVLGIRRGDDR